MGLIDISRVSKDSGASWPTPTTGSNLTSSNTMNWIMLKSSFWVTKSGNSNQIIQERIEKALIDQNLLEAYKELLKNVFLVKEWKEDSTLSLVGFLSNYMKKMV